MENWLKVLNLNFTQHEAYYKIDTEWRTARELGVNVRTLKKLISLNLVEMYHSNVGLGCDYYRRKSK